MNTNVNATARLVGLMTACLLIACDRGFAEPLYSGLPRTAWAEKLPEGPIKALFVAPYIALHDSHELAQRLDMEADHVATTHSRNRDPNKFGFEGHYWPELLATSEQVLDKVREALGGDWQVLALGSMPVWSKWPQDLRDSMISAVAAGRSLITIVDPAIEEDFAKAGQLQELQIDADRFPMEDLPGRPRLFRYGRGHVIDFRVRGPATLSQLIQNSFVPSDYEYSAGRAGWYLRLAACPQTQPAIESVTFCDGKLILTATPHRSIAGATLHVDVRRRESFEIPESFKRYMFETDRPIKPGATVTVKTPPLPAGQYHAELRIVNGHGQTLDWNGLQFSVVGSVDLKSVGVERKTVEAGQALTCTLDVEGPTEGLQMTARWYDRWNRRLDEWSFETFTDQFTVTPPSSSLSVLNYVQVTLSSSRGPEAVAVAEVLMPENVRPADDFHVLCWPGTDGNQYFQIDALRRHCKVDAIANCSTAEGSARNAAFYHLRTVPYAASIRGPFRRFLVPEDTDHWLARCEEAVRKAARNHKPYNTLAYTLGDENFVDPFRPESRFVDDPLAWEKFGQFLRELHPDIGSLNAQWGSSFADFDSIRFETEKQMLGSLDNPSAWVDYRLFAEQVFTQLHQRMANAIRQEHPGAIVGIDGAEQFSSYDGYDWWLLAKDLDLLNVYTRSFVPDSYPNKIFNGQAVQSFGSQAKIKGGWLNHADLDYGGLFHTWYLALNGWNSVWWWRATMHPSIGPIQWNLQPNGVARGMALAAEEIKAGPGTMLAHAQKQLDPIAVYYSSTNWHASTIESGIGYHINHLGLKQDLWWAPLHIPDPQQRALWAGIVPKGHYGPASKNFYLLLHDLGFQPRMVARQQIEAGALGGAGIKALMLPFVVALSDREAEAIRQFVTDGGMVIADYRCGVRDLHGRLRDRGILDDLFGIQRQHLDVQRKRQRVVYDANAGATQRGCQFNSVFHDLIVADGAHVQGVHEDGTGAFFYRNHEDGGKTLYFNSDIYAYYELRKRGLETDLREVMRAVLGGLRDNTGPFVAAKFVPESRGGHPVGQIEVTRFRDGDTLYFGVLPDYAVDDKRPKEVDVPFPRHRHVYDVRARRYLGEGGVIPDVLEPGQPKMYAAFRYKVTGVLAECPVDVQRGHQADVKIRVRGSGEMVGPHAVRIEVALPDGTRPEYLARTVYLPEGRGSYSLTPALNTPKGDWRIMMTECASGVQGSRIIRIR